MKTIKELLKKDKHIWLFVEEDYKKEFLQFALNNGCTWLNGTEIKPNEDNCGHFMAITKNKHIGFIAAQCWIMQGKDMPRKIKFSDILGEEYEQSCN